MHRLKGVIEESCLGYLRPREKETQLQRYMVAFACLLYTSLPVLQIEICVGERA